MRAVITSDLHISSDPNVSDAIIPLMRLQKEVYDAFFAQVADLYPDVFILTGDHTVSGKETDMLVLCSYLEKLRNKGIRVILTTGNHDFDHCTASSYEKHYFPFLDILDKDRSSLSYLARVDDMFFLAMDDHCEGAKTQGCLSEKTVRWLKKKLCEVNPANTIFLSHHNIYGDGWMHDKEKYCLQPSGIKDYLKDAGIRLACSSHMHQACIYGDESLYEIVTPMPLNPAHLFGLLETSGPHTSYRLVPVDFREYGTRGLSERVRRKDQEAADRFEQAFRSQLKDHEHAETMTDFLMLFREACDNAQLRDKRKILITHPGYEEAMDFMKDSMYGKWMACLLEEKRNAQDHLEI